jgi:hypothetical protein
MNWAEHPYDVIERISKRLSYVITVSNEITNHFDSSDKENNIRTFCLLMLDRLRFASTGIKALPEAYKNDNVLNIQLE